MVLRVNIHLDQIHLDQTTFTYRLYSQSIKVPRLFKFSTSQFSSINFLKSMCNYPGCNGDAEGDYKACNYHRELDRLKKQLKSTDDPVDVSFIKNRLVNHKKTNPMKKVPPKSSKGKKRSVTGQEITHSRAEFSHCDTIVEERKQTERQSVKNKEIVRRIREDPDGTKVTDEVER
jgi:hypothetical protein